VRAWLAQAVVMATLVSWRRYIYNEVEALRRHGVRVNVACELVAERLRLDWKCVAVVHFREAANRTLLTAEHDSSSVRFRSATGRVSPRHRQDENGLSGQGQPDNERSTQHAEQRGA
jgi:hypothetical protein